MILFFVLILWMFAATPSVHWLDSTQLGAASFGLGISHPPGQVTHALVTSSLQWLPVGEVSFRAALGSALGMAAAFAALFSLLKRDVENQKWLGFGVACVALSHLVSMQAIRTEVYGLSAGLLFVALALVKDSQDERKAYLASFIWGLSLVNHPLIGIGALPFFLRGKIFMRAAFAILPAALLIYLPLRAHAGAQWNFGNPDDWERFSWFIRGELYKAYHPIHTGQFFANFCDLLDLVVHSLSPIGTVFVIFGAFSVWKNSPLFLFQMIAAILINVLPLARMSNFWANNPDVSGYLLWSIGLLLFLALHGALALSKKMPRGAIYVPLLLCGFFMYRAYSFWRFERLSEDWSAHRHMVHLMEEPFPDSKVDIASFSTYGFFKYAQLFEGARPDLFLHYRGLRNEYQTAPEYKNASGHFWELAIHQKENGDYDLRDEDLVLADRLVPHGWFYSVGGASNPDWISNYFKEITSVQKEVPFGLDFPSEPLILNSKLHILMAKHRNNPELRKALTEESRRLFPSFEDF